MPIKILEPELVDQIAAGEVIERPAHLIKELIENSIDAHASEIEVDFALGGRFVTVTDDGDGIPSRDLRLAFARHATSKIHEFDDLWGLQSYGFRGEALASIGAVSRMTIISRPQDQKLASRLTSEFGRLGPVDEVSGSFGTIVRVEELFANVPARLKFLRSDAAESTQIKFVLRALAMANPAVSFRVCMQGKLMHLWPATANRRERTAQVLELEQMYQTSREAQGIRMEAVFASPNDAVRNSRQIWSFAQNRWIQDKTIHAAVMEAYRNLLMHGEFPIASVWLEFEPGMVDINIHPTKSQVKYQSAHDVFRTVESGLRQALVEAPWLAEFLPPAPIEIAPPPSAELSAKSITSRGKPPGKGKRAKSSPQTQFVDPQFERTQYQSKTERSRVMDQLKSSAPDYQLAAQTLTQSNAESTRPQWGHLQILGQAHLTYIVAQTDSSLLFIDQHAAHERVAFERLMEGWKKGNLPSQQFLFPLTIDLDEDHTQALVRHAQDFHKMRIELEQGGPSSVYVTAAPAIINDIGLVKGLTKMAQDLLDKGGSLAFDKIIGDLFATMACHSVVRAGQALGLEEMRQLLVQMDDFPLSSFCPHGRPVFVEYPLRELERDFGRIP